MDELVYFEHAASKIKITSTSARFGRKKYPIAKISAAKTRIKDANRFLRTLLQVCGALLAGISPLVFVVENIYMGALVLLLGGLLIFVSLAIRRSQAYSVILASTKRDFEAASTHSAEEAGKAVDAINAAVKTALKQAKQAKKPQMTPGKHAIE
jgi:hypothetical protein